jgi:hypothetical protein
MKKPTNRKSVKPRPPVKAVTEVNAWVRPITAATYWTLLIGQIKGRVGGTDRLPIVRVEFVYRRDGSRLPKSEFMDFAINKLAFVTDLRARVVKANPAPFPAKCDDYELVTEAEVSSELAEPDISRRTTALKSLAEIPPQVIEYVPEDEAPAEGPLPSKPSENIAATPERRDTLRRRFRDLSQGSEIHETVPGFNTLPLN